MSVIDLDGLSPEDQQALLEELKRRQRAESAEQRARTQIDKALRDRLADMGIKEGDEWEQPTDSSCAYPRDWVARVDGVQWIAIAHAATGKPGESDDWTLVYDEEGELEPEEGEQDE